VVGGGGGGGGLTSHQSVAKWCSRFKSG